MLKKQYVLFFVLVLLAKCGFAQSDVAVAKWAQVPVQVDGKASEWTQPLNFYDNDSKLFFAIANDSTNIYFCFISKEELGQMKWMRGGMKFTLSARGKSKHSSTIAFPLAATGPQQNGAGNLDKEDYQGAEKTMQAYRQQFINSHNTMNASGFTATNGIVPVVNNSGLNLAIGWDTASSLICEIAIPKKEFLGPDTEAAGEITLAVELAAVKQSREDEKADTRAFRSASARRSTLKEPGNEHAEMERYLLSQKTSFKQRFMLSKAAGATP